MKRAAGIACALLPAFANAEAAKPTSDQVRAVAAAVLRQPLYDFRNDTRYVFDFSWLREIFARFFDAIGDFMGALPPATANVIVFLMIAVLVGIFWYNILWFRNALRRSDAPIAVEVDPPPRPDALVADAERRAQEGDYVRASRLLYQAALALLEEKRGGRVRRGLTTTEYLHTFTSDWVVDNLRVFVNLINWKWYREAAFDPEDYASCRRAYRELELRLRAND